MLHTLEALQEFRFELDEHQAISIKLVEGTAECFGLELALEVSYPFGSEAKAAIFTWTGCETSTDYVAEETPMPSYLALHQAFERLRASAVAPSTAVTLNQDESLGPQVLFIGEKESGKTTLIKTLANWAIRAGRARTDVLVAAKDEPDEGEGKSRGVMLVNLDPSEGAMTLPATASIAPLYETLASSTPVYPLGSSSSTGLAPLQDVPNTLPQPTPLALAPALNPLSFWVGHAEWPSSGSKLTGSKVSKITSSIIQQAGEYCAKKMERPGEEALWKGGLLIDTPADWADVKAKADTILLAVREFEVTVIVVVGSEKLNVEMSRLMSSNKTVTVVRVPKSGGVCDLDSAYRKRNADRQIHSYFYGGPAYSFGRLNPHSINVPFEHLKIFRVGEEYQAPDSALPIGASRTTKETQLVEVDPMQPRAAIELVNFVCAISQAEDDAPDEEVVSSPVLGFIHISGLDTTKKKFTILSPMAGRLPRKRAVLGSIDWAES